jgi:ribosome-binding protein aMBF1 (putative translation factor)
MSTTKIDTSLHRRLRDKQMLDPEFRAEYRRARAAIAQVDAVINALDELRTASGRSKAELARQVGKEPSVIRRMFTAEVNPELRTIAALAAALDAEIQIVPRGRPPRRHGRTTAIAV